MAKVVVLWNRGARQGQSSHQIRARLERMSNVVVYEGKNREQAQEMVREACRSGAKRIIAAGGDGTVNTVASTLEELKATQTAMAVLPLGTGNDLARSLGMPLDLNSALQVCLEGEIRPVDAIRVSTAGKRFLAANMVTGGNTGKFTEVLTDDLKQTWGPFCYLRGAVDVLRDLAVYHLEISLDGGEWQKQTLLNLFAANGRCSGGGMTVAPRALLDDGLFDLVLIQDGSPVDLASLTATYALSDFLDHDLIVYRQLQRLEIRSADPFPMTLDGDPQGNLPPLTLECLHHAYLAVVGDAVAASPNESIG